MRALITGGAGFIGSHLADYILDLNEENQAVIVDDLSTGRLSNLRLSTRLHVFDRSIEKAALKDIGTVSVLESLVRQCDAIFHLAAVVGVARVMERPLETITNNVLSTQIILSHAAAHNKPILIASSSEVYGHSRKPLLSENDDCHISPDSRWGYAAGKIADEFTALAHHAQSRLPVVVVRLFNTIGPRQLGKYGMVVPRFIDQALEGEKITVFGSGYQRRTFAWVGNVVRALYQLAQNPAAYGEIINVGGTQETCIYNLADMIKEMTNSPSGIVGLPAIRSGDIQARVPNLSKVSNLIRFKDDMPIQEMLRIIINNHPLHQGATHV